MGVVLPSYLDEALDLIGVSWPNVDEDDYRAMADSMREFAESLDSGTSDLHTAVQDMLGANEGPAADALAAHWDKVQGKHLTNLADIGRAAGAGLDSVALLIEGAKLAAIVQLGILAAEIAAAVAAAPVTLGLSSLAGLAGTQVCRVAVRRIFREVQQAVVEEIMSRVTAPVEEAIGAMVGDLVVQTGSSALGLQDGVDLGRTVKAGEDSLEDAGKASMQIASAGSGGGGAGGGSGGRRQEDRRRPGLVHVAGERAQGCRRPLRRQEPVPPPYGEDATGQHPGQGLHSQCCEQRPGHSDGGPRKGRQEGREACRRGHEERRRKNARQPSGKR